MSQLLKKDQQFVWTKECQDAFNKIKDLLTSSPVLVAVNSSKPFVTGFGKTDHNVTIDILRNTDLMY